MIEHQRVILKKRKIHGDKNENAGRLRRTEKMSATINSGHSQFAGKKCPAGLSKNFRCANHAPRTDIAPRQKIKNALSLSAI